MAVNSELLEEIGLTKSEIKVYLALLELGSSTTGPIVDKSGASSSKIYEILDRLMQKGLVSYIIKAGTKYFEAADPKRILDYLKEKETKLKQQEKAIESLLPELELKRTLSKYKSEAKIFKGVKGGETAFKHLLNSMTKDDEWIAFVVSFTNRRYFDTITRLHDQRAKKGLKARIIFNEKLRKEAERERGLPHTHIKYVSDEFQTPAIVNVVGNITLLNIMAEDITVFMIENKEVADSFRAQFEKLWRQDVETHQGIKGMRTAFFEALDATPKGSTTYVYGASITSEQTDALFFEYNRKRADKGVKLQIIFSQEAKFSSTTRSAREEFNPLAEIRFTSQTKTPSTYEIFPDRVIITTTQSNNPTAIVIKNKELVETFKIHFKDLWGQKVQTYSGVEGFKQAFTEARLNMKRGDEELTLGGGLLEMGDELDRFFQDFDSKRAEQGVKLKAFLNTAILVGTPPDSLNPDKVPLSEFKFSSESTSPYIIDVIGEQLIIAANIDKRPITTVITDKHTVDTFKRHFHNLWEQKSRTFEGEGGVRAVLDDMLNYKEVWFIGGNDGIKKYFPEYWKEHDKERVKRKVFWHDLIDTRRMAELFQGRETKTVPYYECKILPKELSSPHVIALYGNKVANIIWGEKTIITVIEDKNIMEGYKKHFDYLWNSIR